MRRPIASRPTSVLSFGPIATADTGLLEDPLTVLISDNGRSALVHDRCRRDPVAAILRLITNGYIERWPFDSHSVDVAFVSLQTVDGEPTPSRRCSAARLTCPAGPSPRRRSPEPTRS